MGRKILVTGGAGYIGSFMVRKLLDSSCEPVILDNLSQGHRESVEGFRLEQIDLVTQKEKLDQLLSEESFDGVIHMASFIQMSESYINPAKYYENNIIGFLNLMDSMKKNNVKKIIISSSAGVYGNPEKVPIEEDDLKDPLNPYGETKYIMERILDDYDLAYGIKYTSLRYFNAAGAAIDGSIGEAHGEESHLIPNIILSALAEREFTLFGDNYNTPDGTCIRDYIHVLDLADIHLLTLEKLLQGGGSAIYNVGMGKGYSNNQVIDEIKKVTGLSVIVKALPRREGDAGELYASVNKIKRELDWEPKYTLTDIVKSAFLWHKSHPKVMKFKGYLMILVSALAFGSYGTWSRLVGVEFGIFFQGWVRSAIILLFLIPVGFITKSFKPIKKKDVLWLAAPIVIGCFTQAPLYYAFNNMDIGTATLIFYSTYVITSYFVGRLVFNEKIGYIKLISLVLAFIGLLVMFGISLARFSLLAMIMATLNGIASGSEVSTTKRSSNKFSSIQLGIYMWLGVLVTHLPLSLIFGERQIPFAFNSTWLAMLGFAAAGLVGLWTVVEGYKYVEASIGGLIGLFEIIFGVFFGVLFFQEKLTSTILLGGVLILISAMLPDLSNIIDRHREID